MGPIRVVLCLSNTLWGRSAIFSPQLFQDNTALHIAVEKLSNSVASVIRGSDGGAKLDQMKNNVS